MSEILKNTIWGESRVDGKYDYLINPKTIFNFLSIAERNELYRNIKDRIRGK